MFYRMYRSAAIKRGKDVYLKHAQNFINMAKANARNSERDMAAFLCGNSGIHAVSAVIAFLLEQKHVFNNDLKEFNKGYHLSKPINYDHNGCDEMLVGRAGYIMGQIWLNDLIDPPHIEPTKIMDLCRVVIESGRVYSKSYRSALPLMYHYHGQEYIGAAHGVAGILLVLLKSPLFAQVDGQFQNISKEDFDAVKTSVDDLLGNI